MAKQSARAAGVPAITRTVVSFEKKLTTAFRQLDTLQQKLTALVVESREVYKTRKEASDGFARVLESLGTMSDASISARKSEMLAVYSAPANVDVSGMMLRDAVKAARAAAPKKERKPRQATAATKEKSPASHKRDPLAGMTGLEVLAIAAHRLAKEATDPAAKAIVDELEILANALADALKATSGKPVVRRTKRAA